MTMTEKSKRRREFHQLCSRWYTLLPSSSTQNQDAEPSDSPVHNIHMTPIRPFGHDHLGLVGQQREVRLRVPNSPSVEPTTIKFPSFQTIS